MPLATGSLALTLVSLVALLAGYVFLFGLWWLVFRHRGGGRGG